MVEDPDSSVDLRYRLDVAARTPVDAVERVGGWLFDRARAGWDVTVFVAEPGDPRPLWILGVEMGDLEKALELPHRLPAALSVAAELYTIDPRLRDVVRTTLSRRTPEITVWGGSSPELGRKTVAACHALGAAARTHKAHALAAAHVRTAAVDSTEILGLVRRNPRVAEDHLCEQSASRVVGPVACAFLAGGGREGA
ncbi:MULTISPECIES: hypothetical protein [Mycobacteriaceae]|uniref:hypothetical protein n=1 Tax=Mycobacteriaceae TaxID=1762 RepID=UPI00157B758C|nr:MULTISPECIES: hypothetical protein [Mycobacteriaceae]